MGQTQETLVADSDSARTLTLEVENVTRTRSVTATFQSAVRVGDAAAALASRLSMPSGVPYALRSNRTAGYLEDGKSLGEAVEPGDKLCVTPKCHLGGA